MTQKLWLSVIGVVGLVLFTGVSATLAADWGAGLQGLERGLTKGYQMGIQRQQLEMQRQRMEMELEIQRQQMEMEKQRLEREKQQDQQTVQQKESIPQTDEGVRRDGYWWEKVSVELRPITMAAYLTGYEAGHFGGELSSAVKAVEAMKEEVDRIVKTDKRTVKYKDALVALQGSVIAKVSANLTSYKSLFGEGPSHYVAELDSFYETYPLCKGRHIKVILLQLCDVWKAGGKASYKQVGETCLAKQK